MIPSKRGLKRRLKMAWFGSFQNRIYERTENPEPEVGMGVTEIMYSDRNPWEIIEIKDDRHITVRALDWKRVDSWGMSEAQEYEYTSNPENRTKNLFLTKQGQWKERIGRNGLGVTVFTIGRAERYYDFTF